MQLRLLSLFVYFFFCRFQILSLFLSLIWCPFPLTSFCLISLPSTVYSTFFYTLLSWAFHTNTTLGSWFVYLLYIEYDVYTISWYFYFKNNKITFKNIINIRWLILYKFKIKLYILNIDNIKNYKLLG